MRLREEVVLVRKCVCESVCVCECVCARACTHVHEVTGGEWLGLTVSKNERRGCTTLWWYMKLDGSIDSETLSGAERRAESIQVEGKWLSVCCLCRRSRKA